MNWIKIEPLVEMKNNISLNIIDKCNFNCSYCFAKNHKFDFLNKKIIKFVIDEITKLNKPYYFYFMGGEPILHPDIIELVKYSEKINQNNKLSYSVLVTNFSKNISFLKKFHIVNNNVIILISIHPEYQNYYNNLKDKIKILQDKNYIPIINLLLLDNKKYYNFYHSIIEMTQKLNIELAPIFIFDSNNSSKIYEYSKEFFKEFNYINNIIKKIIKVTFDNNEIKEFTLLEAVENNIINTKGSFCSASNIVIENKKLKMRDICRKYEIENFYKLFSKNKLQNNLINNDYFICSNNSCTCRGNLIFPKFKNE